MEREEYGFHNYTEELVKDALKDMLEKRDDICKCSLCWADMASLALNQLEPKYVTTQKGEIYSRLEEFKFQVKADVIINVTKAIEKVKERPRHSQG